MSDRIQFRRDTAARWTQFNPFLLEGEIGFVLDNPNQYKVGDGVHYWNDLPLRGFNGNIVNQRGQSEDSVMSQKAVTDAINSNTAYLYCISNAGDNKVVQNTGFDINNGIRLLIKMQHANTKTSDVTLQVGTTDAKPIIYNGAAVTDENTWGDNEILDVFYDGTNYVAYSLLSITDVHDNLQAMLTCINTNCASVLGGQFSISETATNKLFNFTFTANTSTNLTEENVETI